MPGTLSWYPPWGRRLLGCSAILRLFPLRQRYVRNVINPFAQQRVQLVGEFVAV